MAGHGLYIPELEPDKPAQFNSTEINSSSMSDDKGYIQSAVDKTKEVVNDVKESLREGYTKMTGDHAEDRAADKVKNAADSCAQKAGECRDKISNKMHEGARHVESH